MFLFSRINRAQLWLCVFFCAGFIAQASADELLDSLWAAAEARALWDDPEWWTLGHYHRTMWGTVSSRMDDPRFFLHAQGKHNRRLELQATLTAFVNPDTVGGSPSVACRFPARRKWLLRKLELPDTVFPGGDCAEFSASLAELQIESATLVYPSAYLNSPASMFGHLLLVLERKGKDRLLSRAVNYAANVEDSFGPLFAVKGIFGLYDGVYTMLPYYDKVEEYAAVNRRDIWEYPLKLEAEELDMLLRHVWELQSLKSRYFFFKENCAFNLLYPLQVARPSLALVRRFRMSAVPVSLLQQLAQSGVTGDPVYRASKATEMSDLAEGMSAEEIRHVRALVAGAEMPEDLSPAQMGLVIAWIQYLYTEQEMTPEDYRTRILPWLRARSKMGKLEMPPPPLPAPPDQGHAPRRAMAYGGVDTVNGQAFYGIRLRAAYHDWLDDPTGYPAGSSIRMFELDVQARPESGELFLNELTLMDIRSQTPPAPWVRPLSWAVAFGAESDPFDPGQVRGVGRFASGFTLEPHPGIEAYLMLSQQLFWDTALEENLSWEPGFQWGLLRPSPGLALGLRGWHHWGVLGYAGERHWVEAEARVFVNRNFSLGLSVQHREESQRQAQLLGLNVAKTF